MGKHFNAKLDDAAWRALFGRWHAGEDSRALRREAGAAPDTWSANAKRLGMRIRDLPAGHPAKRGAPAFADRSDDYRHPNSRLTEGQWRALFALRAAGTPDTVLVARFGVHAATICSQAEARGIRRADLRAGVRTPPVGEARCASFPLRCATSHLPTEWGGDGECADRTPPLLRGPPPHSPGGEQGGDVPLEESVIDPDDPEATRAAFKAAIREAGRREDYHRIQAVCGAQNAMEKAFFAKAEAKGAGVESPSAASPSPSPFHGEETKPLVLRPPQGRRRGTGRRGCFWAGAGRGRLWRGRRGFRTWRNGAGGWPWSGRPCMTRAR